MKELEYLNELARKRSVIVPVSYVYPVHRAAAVLGLNPSGGAIVEGSKGELCRVIYLS